MINLQGNREGTDVFFKTTDNKLVEMIYNQCLTELEQEDDEDVVIFEVEVYDLPYCGEEPTETYEQIGDEYGETEGLAIERYELRNTTNKKDIEVLLEQHPEINNIQEI